MRSSRESCSSGLQERLRVSKYFSSARRRRHMTPLQRNSHLQSVDATDIISCLIRDEKSLNLPRDIPIRAHPSIYPPLLSLVGYSGHIMSIKKYSHQREKARTLESVGFLGMDAACTGVLVSTIFISISREIFGLSTFVVGGEVPLC